MKIKLSICKREKNKQLNQKQTPNESVNDNLVRI